MKEFLRALIQVLRSAVYLALHLPHVLWIIFGFGRSSKQFWEASAAFARGKALARVAANTTGVVRERLMADAEQQIAEHGDAFAVGFTSKLSELEGGRH